MTCRLLDQFFMPSLNVDILGISPKSRLIGPMNALFLSSTISKVVTLDNGCKGLVKRFFQDTQHVGYKWYLGKLKILDLAFTTTFHKSQCPKI